MCGMRATISYRHGPLKLLQRTLFCTAVTSRKAAKSSRDAPSLVEYWRAEPLESQIACCRPIEITEVEKRQRLTVTPEFLQQCSRNSHSGLSKRRLSSYTFTLELMRHLGVQKDTPNPEVAHHTHRGHHGLGTSAELLRRGGTTQRSRPSPRPPPSFRVSFRCSVKSPAAIGEDASSSG